MGPVVPARRRTHFSALIDCYFGGMKISHSCQPNGSTWPVQMTLDVEALGPLIERSVQAAIVRLDELRAPFGDRLAFSEAEAARLIGLEEHQLRDERRRGRIKASQIVNRSIRYLRGDLIDYLMRQRINDGERRR
jgi:hypothetical protein